MFYSYIQILLDGRTLRTPAGRDLHMPNFEIALAVASEWDAQAAGHPKGIQPATMPLMTLVATAIDQCVPNDHFVKKTCLGMYKLHSFMTMQIFLCIRLYVHMHIVHKSI
jgi:chaperone required for assembly of F1-ATPase